jgi:hypothetical protein
VSKPAALWAHEHVTEREPDGTWEDCTFTAGLMHARVALRASIPATHAEMQALRAASGLSTHGGANIDDLQRGYARRYGWSGGTEVKGFSNLWYTLRPGRSATAQGSMAAFPSGHRLRRWDPGFRGAHAVLIARLDTSDRVWWDDPLAPLGVGYEGEWVTKAQLKAYVDRLTVAGGRHVISNIIPKPAAQPPEGDTLKPGDDFNYGWESYTLDGTHTVYCLGGPRNPDGTTDSDMRLCAAGPGSKVLTVVPRSRLTNGKRIPGSDILYQKITTGTL